MDTPIARSQTTLQIRGRLHGILKDRHGCVLLHRFAENLVVDQGLKLAADFLVAAAPVAPNWIGLGSGSTAVLSTDIALDTEIPASLTALTSRTAFAGPPVQLDYVGTITVPAVTTWNVREVGIFNNAGGGNTLFARLLTQNFTMTDGDSFDFTWTLLFSGAT